MNQKQKSRWMKIIVAFCLIFCACFAVGAFVAMWFNVDETEILKVVFGLFGGELLMNLVIKLVKDKDGAKKTEAKPTGRNDEHQGGNG